MSSFKPAAALLGLLLLSGCGFTPVYARHDNAPAMQQQLQNVDIGLIPNREGQYLRNALLDKMSDGNAGRAKKYFLRVYDLRIDQQSIGIRKDASATRQDVTISGQMELVDQDSGNVVLQRALHVEKGYNQFDNLYSSVVSQEDTTDRLLDEMSDRVLTELTLYFGRP